MASASARLVSASRCRALSESLQPRQRSRDTFAAGPKRSLGEICSGPPTAVPALLPDLLSQQATPELCAFLSLLVVLESDRFKFSGGKGLYKFAHSLDSVTKPGATTPYVADGVRIASADSPVAELLRIIHGNLVFVGAATSVVNLHDAYTFGDSEFLSVRKHADTRSPRMGRCRNRAVLLDSFQNFRQWVVDARKIEFSRQCLSHAINEYVSVFRFDLTPFENDETVLFLQ